MSESPRLERILDQARGKEKKYYWVEAAKLYERALNMAVKEDFFERGEIQKKIGRSLYRAAFQAESPEEFKECMTASVEAYIEASKLFKRLAEPEKYAKMMFCKGMAAYGNVFCKNSQALFRKI